MRLGDWESTALESKGLHSLGGSRELKIDCQRYARDRLTAQHSLRRANGCVIDLHDSKIVLSEPVLIAMRFLCIGDFQEPFGLVEHASGAICGGRCRGFFQKKQGGAEQNLQRGSVPVHSAHAK